jgi:peptidoglycan/LPS O-acetylase OafA/YrhL
MTTHRVYYLDWLRVLAILGVFFYHALRPFDLTEWHIKNVEMSLPLTAVLLFFAPWGMPFFFLVAGTGTWFALQHRTPRRYVHERFKRLLVPYLFGVLLLTPIMLCTEWAHKVRSGVLNTTFQEFVGSRSMIIGPEIFGWAGYHLWFLGFLFSFSLLALPIFLWLRHESGQRWVARLAGLCEHRGGLLLAVIPLLAFQLAFRLFFYEGEHNWADFFFMLAFFVLGYVLFCDERFTHAIRREWRLHLGIAVATTAVILSMVAFGDGYGWVAMPWLPGFYLIWALIVINGWCWTLAIMFVGMHFLDFSNRTLQYGQEAILPFFLFHQPVIMGIAFFVVQWELTIPVKLMAVVVGSFAVTVGLYELFIRRSEPLRLIFGMKSRRLHPGCAE